MKVFLSKFRISSFTLAFLCCATFTFAQEKNLTEITAQVIDEKDKSPIVFATVQFKNKKNGMITDENGYFRLPYKYKEVVDTLQISSIGYATKEIPIASLQYEDINTILLTPKIELLDEVVLVGDGKRSQNKDSGLSLVKKAIDNITKNYPTLPHSYIGYYRDYQKVDNQYLNLNEAIIEVFDEGIQTNKILDTNNQTLLYQYKSNADFPIDRQLSMAYNQDRKYIKNAEIANMGGNELSILNLHDPIRNYNRLSFSFIDIFQTDFIANHNFKATRVSYLNDLPLYEIEFKYVRPITRHEVRYSNQTFGFGSEYSAKGTIYISPENYAIHKLEYHLLYRNKPFCNLQVEYMLKGNSMYLNYISFNNFFKVMSTRDFDIKEIILDIDQNTIFVKFTNPIKKTSLKRVKDFRFKYKNRKLSIDTFSISEPDMIKLQLVKGSPIPNEIRKEGTLENLTYKIKNVLDVKNQKLGKKQAITANQFRELFVQEIFPGKSLPKDAVFINKTRPLKNATIDDSLDGDTYWINTPLKSTAE
ncbi:MAG: carboxypeptidase-like regulatory domain-containing protein [Maribacter sp.]